MEKDASAKTELVGTNDPLFVCGSSITFQRLSGFEARKERIFECGAIGHTNRYRAALNALTRVQAKAQPASTGGLPSTQSKAGQEAKRSRCCSCNPLPWS
jgi:hypothetical protein